MADQEEEMIPSPLPFSPVGFTHTESLKSLAPALVAAQKRLKNPPKDSKNPHFGNHFAGLGVTMDAAREALNSQDVAILTPPCPAPDGYIGIAVILLHKSGEYIEGRGYIPLERSNAQGAGSAITYARRYYVQAAMGFVGDDDDDGEVASRGTESHKEERVNRSEGKTNTPPRKGLFGRR